jgi:hypothetical protein
MYGSNLRKLTFNPLSSRRDPIDEDANPFPKEETTPPVVKIYFVFVFAKKFSPSPSTRTMGI